MKASLPNHNKINHIKNKMRIKMMKICRYFSVQQLLI